MILFTILFTILFKFIQIVFGYLLADFLAGIYHWIKDTYFTPFTPIIGKTFIWGSRLHHVIPQYILEFSDSRLFIESATWNLLWYIPVYYIWGMNLFILSLFFIISSNDIIHKYAHVNATNDKIKIPLIIHHLQKYNIIQNYDEHHIHHLPPHINNYCPITPYVNNILEKINFFIYTENLIEKIFGIKPRSSEYNYIFDPKYPAGIRFIPSSN